MCQESIDMRTQESLMIEQTKKYLLKNKNNLIAYALQMILDSKSKYRYSLIDNQENFKNSVSNDFDLIIRYCDELDDDIYEENRIILDGFDSIYCDFYNYLYQFINNENIDEWIIDNLTDTFEFLAGEHCKG